MDSTCSEVAAPAAVDGMRRLGGAASLLSAIQFGLDPTGAMKRLYAENGPLTELSFRSPTGRHGSRYVHAVGAKYNERVLGDPATFETCGVLLPGPKGSAQRRIRNGLLTAKGLHHTHYRRLMTPPLRRKAVDQSAVKMGEVVDRVIEQWPINKTVDLFPLVRAVALHVALETLFSTDGDSLLEESLRAAALMNEHFQMDASVAVKGCPINLPGLPYHRMLAHAAEVESTIAAWARRGSVECHPNSLLSILARSPDEAGAAPTEALITSHLLTMFGASYETSQSGLAWALFLLAQHPAAAAALLEEIERSLGTGADKDIAHGPWLDAVVKEGLRILPPVPVQIRHAVRDADLVDHAVPAGTYVVLSAFLTNRNPTLYADPHRFKPERWASIDPTQYEYVVFSAGPRFCIGAWFATTFLKVAIDRITRRYRIKLAPNARVDQTVGLTMSPAKSGIAVTIHPQDGRFDASPVRGNIQKIIER